MLRKWIGRIFIASAIALILVAASIAFYYNFILKDHEGPMDLWAIIALCVPFIIFVISRVIIDVKKIKFSDSFNEKGVISKISNVFANIFVVIAMIPLFPIIIVFTIIQTVTTTPSKKTFKKLINKGFSYIHKDKKYILKKEDIIIEISNGLTDYFISFDNGASFVRVEESNLGTSYDRDELKYKLNDYLSAHPVDIQRGDAVPPFTEYIEFLNINLK
ncbi:MAG: hypothetical protein MR270_05755 [Erysipelotrichaceae bacterium]|nr:hypothetical protein [Erysipelotrichaceae bacterium]